MSTQSKTILFQVIQSSKTVLIQLIPYSIKKDFVYSQLNAKTGLY